MLPHQIQPLTAEPQPEYPTKARQSHLTGKGVFWLYLDKKTGRVVKIKVAQSTGHNVLDTAATAALRYWRFARGLAGVVVPVNFTMREGAVVGPFGH